MKKASILVVVVERSDILMEIKTQLGQSLVWFGKAEIEKCTVIMCINVEGMMVDYKKYICNGYLGQNHHLNQGAACETDTYLDTHTFFLPVVNERSITAAAVHAD